MTDVVIRADRISKDFRVYRQGSKLLTDRLFNTIKGRNQYDTLNILKDVSFEVRRGEMVGVIGNNGAGKTTLLKILAGILKPSSGKVIARGKVIPIIQLGVGFNPDLTSIDNIVMYGMILGFTKKQIIEKVPEILKFAELENYGNVAIRHFSSGMHARLAFSTAISVDPDILLVDEVLSVGDFSFRQKSFDAFIEMKNKKTIIFVTHALDQVKNLCDRALLLHDGRVAEMGEPATVIEKYLGISSAQSKETAQTSLTEVRARPVINRPSIFTDDSIFLSTKDGKQSLNRLRYRSKVLIEDNQYAFRDKSVLDLGSYDGRFIYAAIKSGAKYVEGIEARSDLVDLSYSNLEYCKLEKQRYKITKGDIFNEMTKIEPRSYDTVLCLGIMNNIISHPDLLSRITRLNPQYLIIDTEVNKIKDMAVSLTIRDGNPYSTIRGDRIVGIPSRQAIEFLLSHYKFVYTYLDWNKVGITDWTDLEDYKMQDRVSIVAVMNENEKLLSNN